MCVELLLVLSSHGSYYRLEGLVGQLENRSNYSRIGQLFLLFMRFLISHESPVVEKALTVFWYLPNIFNTV